MSTHRTVSAADEDDQSAPLMQHNSQTANYGSLRAGDASKHHLQRGLSTRQVSMIAISGTIGTGVFVMLTVMNPQAMPILPVLRPSQLLNDMLNRPPVYRSISGYRKVSCGGRPRKYAHLLWSYRLYCLCHPPAAWRNGHTVSCRRYVMLHPSPLRTACRATWRLVTFLHQSHKSRFAPAGTHRGIDDTKMRPGYYPPLSSVSILILWY